MFAILILTPDEYVVLLYKPVIIYLYVLYQSICHVIKYSNVTMNDECAIDIDDIEYLMHGNECNAFIISGDFNTCYLRNNAQTRALLEFEDRNDLLNARHNNNNTVRDYTYINHSLSHISCIDHFLVSQNVFHMITKNTINYDSINPSSQGLMELKLRCNTSYI